MDFFQIIINLELSTKLVMSEFKNPELLNAFLKSAQLLFY